MSNHGVKQECWIFAKRGRPTDTGVSTLWYIDAVEEALCFGWIDSVNRTIPPYGHAQRFSPRTKNSQWSELNKERCRRLEKIGMMTAAGRNILPDMSISSFVIDDDIKLIINSDPELKKNFYSFPELYQRVRVNSIQREKKKPHIYAKMIENFIKNTKCGKMYGQWNDYGRLLSY